MCSQQPWWPLWTSAQSPERDGYAMGVAWPTGSRPPAAPRLILFVTGLVLAVGGSSTPCGWVGGQDGGPWAGW